MVLWTRAVRELRERNRFGRHTEAEEAALILISVRERVSLV